MKKYLVMAVAFLAAVFFDGFGVATASATTPPPFDGTNPVAEPHIQDFVGECDAAFVLDNSGSNIPVTYTINGVSYVVPAESGLHTDFDGTRIQPNLEGEPYVITTDTGQTWTFPGNVCVDTPPIETDPPVTPEPTPPIETEEPVEPPVDYPMALNAGIACTTWGVAVDNIAEPVHILVVVDGVIRFDGPVTSNEFTMQDGIYDQLYPQRTLEVIITDKAGEILDRGSYISELCPVVEPPVTEEPVEPTPEPSETPAPPVETEEPPAYSAPAPTIVPAASAPEAPQETLPETGGELFIGAGIFGLAALIIGAGLRLRRHS